MKTIRYKNYVMHQNQYNWIKVVERSADLDPVKASHENTILMCPVSVVSGKTAKEIVDFGKRNLEAYHKVNKEFEAFRNKYNYTVNDVTFGYIGNYYIGYNDVSWRFFIKGTKDRSVGDYASWEFETLSNDLPWVFEMIQHRILERNQNAIS